VHRSTAAISFAVLLGCGGQRPVETASPLPSANVTARPPPVVVDDDIELASDVVEQTINPAKLPVYRGPSGVVDGTVVANGAPVAQALTGITGYAGFIIRDDPEVVMNEQRASFDPSVIIMTYGQALVIENDASEDRHPMFEQQHHKLSIHAGSSIRLHPKLPGRYKLVDGALSADVYVAMTPLHATTDARGHFRISHVPVGKLNVHAALAAHQSQAEIDVKENATTNVTLTLP
jgi:hypothetical protein